jgi:hypothetical protein
MGLILRLLLSVAAASVLALAVLMLIVWLSRVNVPQDFSNSQLESTGAESGQKADSGIDCQGYEEAIRLGFDAGNLPAELYCSITVAELLFDAERYDGTLVSIDGEFGAPFEGSYIADTSSASRLWFSMADNPYPDQCRLTGQLRGVFRNGPSGHLGLYDGKLSVLAVGGVDDSQAYPCGSAGPASRPADIVLE